MYVQRIPTATTLAVAIVALLTVLFARESSAAEWSIKYRNVTAGGELRPGVYGRIDFEGVPPPPLIYRQPIVGSARPPGASAQPVYLYVPPGQVRKWPQNCARWKACDVPVLFVRIDDSPSRLGSWKQRREHLTLHAAVAGRRD